MKHSLFTENWDETDTCGCSLSLLLEQRGAGTSAENESEGVERVTLVFIGMPEEAWLRCGPAPETR